MQIITTINLYYDLPANDMQILFPTSMLCDQLNVSTHKIQNINGFSVLSICSDVSFEVVFDNIFSIIYEGMDKKLHPIVLYGM